MRTLKEVDKIYPEKELLTLIKKSPDWWHPIPLSDKVTTPGTYPMFYWNKILDSIPKDLSNKHILDVGAHQGGFSFACERRNAKEITAIDIYSEIFTNEHILLCKKILDSEIKVKTMDVMNVKELNEKFDIILLLGVLYTVLNPFGVLQALFEICNELIIVEAEILRSNRSICYVLEGKEVVPNQRIAVLFSPTALKNYATWIGFKKVEFLGYHSELKTPIKSDKNVDQLTHNRGIFYLWK